MRRREFIAGLAGAATWPVAELGQRATMPVVGYLHCGSPDEGSASAVAALRKELSQTPAVAKQVQAS
jgi:hypothetical protein